MAKFAYNNAKNTSTGHTLFKLNSDYYPKMLYEDDINFCSQSKTADKLLIEL